ncbi:hypothetical protein BH09MYX1_BH09MYX1_06690 [soil metagenome]
MIRTTIIVGVAALGLGGTVGFYLGRFTLEQKWRDSITQVSPEDAAKASQKGADPTPKPGTKVLRSMPIGRVRVALAEFGNKDPVKVTVGTFGRNDTTTELHLNIHNETKCEVTSVEGVAYGFDAWGTPTAVNEGGENYVSFAVDKLKVEPGGKGYVAQEMHHAPLANMAIAHIDGYTCSDGTSWKRN